MTAAARTLLLRAHRLPPCPGHGPAQLCTPALHTVCCLQKMHHDLLVSGFRQCCGRHMFFCAALAIGLVKSGKVQAISMDRETYVR